TCRRGGSWRLRFSRLVPWALFLLWWGGYASSMWERSSILFSLHTPPLSSRAALAWGAPPPRFSMCLILSFTVGRALRGGGMVALLQPGLTQASLHDYRLGQILEALFAAQLNRVFGAIALNALEVYALSTPWLHQDTTTISLYGAYEEEARPGKGLVPPRP